MDLSLASLIINDKGHTMPYPVSITMFAIKKDPLTTLVDSLHINFLLKRQINSILNNIKGEYTDSSYLRNQTPVEITNAIEELTKIASNNPNNATKIEQ